MKATKSNILAYLKKIKPKLQQDGIINLGLFGSYAKNNADLASDIDIAFETTTKFANKFVGFKAFVYLENLRNELSNIFHIKVDFCDISGFKNNPKKKDDILDGVIYV